VNSLLSSLVRLAQLQKEDIDSAAVQEAIHTAESTLGDEHKNAQAILEKTAKKLQLGSPNWVASPDPAQVPALIYHASTGWGILRGLNAHQQWITEWYDPNHGEQGGWIEQAQQELKESSIALLKLVSPFQATDSKVWDLVKTEIFSHKKVLLEIAVGGFIINMVALATSFYSLQVYDRVVPTAAHQTLLVLTMGVMIAILFELVAKKVRSGLYTDLIHQVDQQLARKVISRFLAIRLDSLPASVGALASQLRGYESIRSFFTSMSSHLLIDAPFAILFIAVLATIAPALAPIPALFLLVSLAIGLYYQKKVTNLAKESIAASNRKNGFLVESVEGAELIKAGHGSWRMLNAWTGVTDLARDNELEIRNIQEHAQYLTQTAQQTSYILIVAAGALEVTQGELTMGGLIACSILSGRILSPVATIPAQLVQWANTKAAIQGLDQIWELPSDHDGESQPLTPQNIFGNYQLNEVHYLHNDRLALKVPKLQIQAGEKIGILGGVGSGKTTLLRILSGLYKSDQGRVLLDGMDITQISRPILTDNIGYLQQEGRLFAGTLRENLLLGMMDPGDVEIIKISTQTGLQQSVIASHPKGLQQPIYEGGTGLSGGQRQLLHLTRILLRKPTIWILDEPTASMDQALEQRIIQTLQAHIKPHHTLILVTHKTQLLDLVERLLVITDHQLHIDGEKQQVIQHLQQGGTS